MKTLKFKTVASNTVRCSLQHPSAAIGMSEDGRVCTYEITDIPNETPASEVLRLLDGSITWGPRCSFKFSELGVGCIIRETAR